MSLRAPAKKNTSVLESDLYPVVARFFEEQGFSVKGEVCGCDLVGVNGEAIIIAELKVTFNIKLLYQAVRRLAITDRVYAVIFKPKTRQKMSYWQMMKSLCRRLHIGLLVVDGDDVLVIAEPGPFSAKAPSKQRTKVLREFNGRRISQNTGGVTGKKLQTAYLEAAIQISVFLKEHKKLKTTELVALGCSERAAKILYHNHYGWFQKTGRGEYKLKAGKATVIARENQAIWQYYAANLTNA
jgi:hypothetical protein